MDRWHILWLHQHISEQVMAASLQVDATLAQIDNEIARLKDGADLGLYIEALEDLFDVRPQHPRTRP